MVQGLLVALENIDEVIRIIRASDDRAQASRGLQDAFGLSETQAGAILDMRLVRLTALEQSQLERRLAELETKIAELRSILESEERQLEVMLEELDDVVKKRSWPRRRRTPRRPSRTRWPTRTWSSPSPTTGT